MKYQPDDLWLQRFVDGELSLGERQAVLVRLDKQPDGWRRLALAFVEMQIWDDEFRAAHGKPAPMPAKASAVRVGRHGTRKVLAMAASLLIACLFGTWLGATWRSLPSAPEVAEEASAKAKHLQSLAAKQDEPERESEPVPRTLRLQFDGVAEGSPKTLDVPLIDVSRVPTAHYSYPRSAIPEDVYGALVSSGYHVSQHRGVVPLRLEGGQQIMLPVDSVQLRYVGTAMYQ